MTPGVGHERVFSVIIPTYNRAALLGQAIDSALSQTFPSGGQVEVVVVDDESTDATPDVVRGYGDSVRYVRQRNRREGAARNNGAAHARGAYFAFLDSDDYWLPGKLAADLERFEAPDRPAMVYSRARNVDHDNRVIGERRLPTPQGDVFWVLAREAFVPMSTVAVRADAFAACGGFVEDRHLSGTADWELWLRIAARWPVGFADVTATAIRVHERNMLSDSAYMERAMLAALRHALSDPAVAARARGRERVIRASMFVTIALNAYMNRRRGRAWRWLLRAACTWPPEVVDARFAGAVSRALLGPGLATRMRRVARA